MPYVAPDDECFEASAQIPLKVLNGNCSNTLTVPIAQTPDLRHHDSMTRFDKRQYPRRRVNLSAVVAPSVPVTATATAVIDLSEGGAALEWNLPDDVAVGSAVRLRFLLAGEQSIEIEGRVVRIAEGRAGVEFVNDQQNLVRQLLAEARSAED